MTLVNWSEKLPAIHAALDKLSNEELMDALCKKLVLTAQSFFEAAVIARYMEEKRQIDVYSTIRPWGPTLRKIAYGQMLPEAMVFSGTNSRLLNRIAALPIPDQQTLLESESLELAEGDDHRLIDPRTAEPWQLKQLFAADHIRPLHEQRQWLRNQTERPRRKSMTLEAKMGADEPDREEMNVSLQVHVSPEEAAVIEGMAKTNGWPKWYAVRRYLRSKG